MTTQIEPTFREHSFVRLAGVYIQPRMWISGRRETTNMLIAYSAHEQVDIDATVEAVALGLPDPNLPPGVTSFDLHRPIVPGPRGDLRIVMSRSYYAGWTRDPEYGGYGGLDAFSFYAIFARDRAGELVCTRADEQYGSHIDRVI